MKRAVFWLCIVVAVAAAILLFVTRIRAVASAETLLPPDTIYYCGTRSPLKLHAALSALDLKGTLEESAGLTEMESRNVSDWLERLQGAHIGFRSFSLVPLVLDATIILEGEFERPLTSILTPAIQRQFHAEAPHRDVALRKAVIPVRGPVALEVYVSEPVQNRIFISFSRRSLTDCMDRLHDGGPSLADNPEFRKVISLKQMRRADVVQYADTQAHLRMLYDWGKSLPQPQVKALVDLLWKELRLADYGISAGGWRFGNRSSCSFLRIAPENPLYQQFQYKSPLVFPHVPADSSRFYFCRLAEPAEAFRRLMDMTVRLKKGLSAVSGAQAMQPVDDFLGQLGTAAGGHPADAGRWLSGSLGMWQACSGTQSNKTAVCFYIGINDADRVREAIASLHLQAVENDGITVVDSGAVSWSVQPDGLLIANDADYLRASLATGESSLTAAPSFQRLLKQMPEHYAELKYISYEQESPTWSAARLPGAFKDFLALFKGFAQMTAGRAEDHMLVSCSAQQFDPDLQAVRAVLKRLFSAEWGPDDFSTPATPPLVLTADEAYSKSISLLSDGRQIDAEELVEKAHRQYPEDVRLLFAQAVLERSRWSNNMARRFFSQVIQRFPDTVQSQASALALALDQHKTADSNMAELVRLSDAHPNDIYLLWLSAIQCREQKMGELGRQRYDKLLSKFQVGPVMLHQTYANILSEVLGDHEAALKYRYIAVSLEAKGWTLQGLANTLTYLKRYQEACAVWARTVQVVPDDADYWGGWGWTLRQMGRYEEALEKHKEAYRLDPSSAYDIHNIGYCLEELRRYDEMIGYYRRGAKLGYAESQRALGWCYDTGRGVEKDLDEAAEWYRLAAEQGDQRAMLNLAALYEKGVGAEPNPAKAISLYLGILRAHPKDALAMNNYAWLLATCKDESFRDYPKAVELARRSVELDEQIYSLDTLAVACERNGQFAQAVEAHKRLMDVWRGRHQGKPVPAHMTERLAALERKAAEKNLEAD